MKDGLSTAVVAQTAKKRAAQHFLEFLLLAVEHLVCAKAAHQFDITRTCVCSQLGTQVLCQLDRKHANAAGACRDEHLLAGPKIGSAR